MREKRLMKMKRLGSLSLLGSALFSMALLGPVAETEAGSRRTEHNLRFGIGVAGQGNNRLGQFDYEPLRLGWFHNWGNTNPPAAGVEFLPLVAGYGKGVPSLSSVKQTIARRPDLYVSGTVWMVGNEIGMDDGRAPADYARDYHGTYHLLKGINPDFLVATGAILPTSRTHRSASGDRITGLEYLRQVRAEYERVYRTPMPVDVYHIHGYAAHDWSNISEFKRLVQESRQYMKDIGEQSKPLMMKEFSPLAERDSVVMRRYMEQAVAYLATARDFSIGMPDDDYRLVQRWAWFVMNDGEEQYEGQWDDLALFDSDTKRRRPLADTYQRLAETYFDKMYRMTSFQPANIAVGQRLAGYRVGDRLVITGKGRTNSTAARLRLSVNYVDAQGVKRNVVVFSNTVSGNTDWKPMRVEFLVPSGARNVEAFFLMSGTGEAWVDGLRAVTRGTDLVQNGSFESGGGSTPQPFWIWTDSPHGTRAGVENWKKAPGTERSMYRMVSQGAWISLGQRVSGWQPGDTLRLLGRGRTLGTGARVSIAVNYVAGGRKYSVQARSNILPGNSGWQTMSSSFFIPSNATAVEVFFASSGTGEVLVDDLSAVNQRTGQELVTNGDFSHGSESTPTPYWLWTSSSAWSVSEVTGGDASGAVRYPWQ